MRINLWYNPGLAAGQLTIAVSPYFTPISTDEKRYNYYNIIKE